MNATVYPAYFVESDDFESSSIDIYTWLYVFPVYSKFSCNNKHTYYLTLIPYSFLYVIYKM